MYVQAPYKPRRPEEEGGDTHATYAYVAADAAAKDRGTDLIGEVRPFCLLLLR